MNALMGNGNDATVTEEQLLDWCIVGGVPLISAQMTTVGSVFLQLGSVEGGDPTLESYERLQSKALPSTTRNAIDME